MIKDKIDKLAWIEIKNKKILSTKSFGKEKYYIPGGKREEGENDTQALKREIFEELNVVIVENSLDFFGIFEAQADSHPKGIFVKMTCYTAKYLGEIKPSSEIQEVKWLNYSNKEEVSEVDKIIFEHLKQKKLID